MGINRRQFIQETGLAAAALGTFNRAWAAPQTANHSSSGQPYGSGYFGSWVEDEFSLPAFHYTCNQIADPRASTSVNPGVLTPTEHIHQVGNDRVVAIASNYGTVRLRQDEGAPKFLNDYDPDHGHFAGGFGYLTDGQHFLSTFFSKESDYFDRFFGIGYFRKHVKAGDYELVQNIFAPFGDDPVLLSQVTVTNTGTAPANLRWIEFWGCRLYQFSFRAFMESFGGKSMHDLRREFADRFAHNFKKVADGSGLLETKDFPGRDPAEEKQFQAMVAFLEKTPNPFLKAPEKGLPRSSVFDDLNPPGTFLISLDAAPDGMSSNAREFFGSGGPARPSNLDRDLDNDLSKSGAETGLLLERKFSLKPGEKRTLSFLYGYQASGFDLDSLVAKYRQSSATALRDSCEHWKQHGLRFSTPQETWVEREVTWNHYYLRSGFTYDDFFHQHIISQASIYQYVMGFQGAARDPLQHVLPFIFSDPDLVREVLRYTLKEVRPDGSIPYGIVGHGVPMPSVSDNTSDMPLWLIWAVSEYVLANRDVRFLDSDVLTVYGPNAGRDSVRNLLARCFKHLNDDVKNGQHGLMRMLQDDWNDALVQAWVAPANLKECLEQGESVVNSAMAAYVFDYYARMLTYAGDDERVTTPIRRKAEDHRAAVRRQWTGKWFRRAWLGPTQGWLGEKGLWIEPQPWTLIAGIPTQEQTHTLLESIDRELRKVSPIGAIQLNDSPDRVTPGVWKTESGTSINGGVWPSLNQTLIWALASLNPDMAWEEWKKNSFAKHAEVYPQIWYGTWSGPDVLNSASSKHPGETTGGKPFGWTDFPVLNMHTHACPLYSLAKLLRLEFTETGISLSPNLPLTTYRFESPLLGCIKSASGYEGWYNPASANTYSVRLHLSPDELKRYSRVEVNASRIRARVNDGAIEIRGAGGNGTPLHWTVSRG